MDRESRSFKISREVRVNAYVVDEQSLRQIDELSRAAVGDPDGGRPIEVSYSIGTTTKELIPVRSLDELVQNLGWVAERARSLSLSYRCRRQSGVEVIFSREGEIRLSGFSDAPDFQFNVDRLQEMLLTLREEHNWAVKVLVFQPRIKKWASFLLPLFSIWLLVCIGYYFRAKAIGVDIDPSLIPRGNEYYQTVANAIRSNDTNQKLNALLLSQLTGFTNVRDFLFYLRATMVTLLSCIAICLFLLGSRKLGERLYPQSFFLFGRNQKLYLSLESKRQMWGVAITLGFFINLVAGVIVATIVR